MANFDDDFLALARSDPYSAVVDIRQRLDDMLESSQSQEWAPYEIEFLLEAYALLCEMKAAGIIDFVDPGISPSAPTAEIGLPISDLIRELASHFEGKHKEAKFAKMRAHFGRNFGSVITYEFTEGDLTRVQSLIAETRDAISKCRAFDEKHRRRLLARLEKLQAEMHKKMADIDVFWGLMGDAGVALNKFGTDVKPVVDRIRELFSIGWQAQSRAEELPSNQPPPRIEHNKSGPPEDEVIDS